MHISRTYKIRIGLEATFHTKELALATMVLFGTMTTGETRSACVSGGRDVQADLQWQLSVDSAHTGIAAKENEENVVTLTGQVAHYAEQSAAEEGAMGSTGSRPLPTTSMPASVTPISRSAAVTPVSMPQMATGRSSPCSHSFEAHAPVHSRP